VTEHGYLVTETRTFANDLEVGVTVLRTLASSPVMVMSRDAQPLGEQWRYRDHVDPEEVRKVVEVWLSTLPEDYCLSGDCVDLRTYWWHQLRERLGMVPCLVKE
jgi:hypothetical protein